MGISSAAGELPAVVIVPGLRDHVADHWQTHLAEHLSGAGRVVHTVPPLTEDGLSCAARVAALQAVVTQAGGPIQLVAHSAGVLITVHWARGHRADVRGALLATPPDLDTPMPEGYPTLEVLAANGWTPAPRQPLPFPSMVATSTNDPLGAEATIVGLAGDWGSRIVALGAVGHLNPASGYGPWPLAVELLAEIGGDPVLG